MTVDFTPKFRRQLEKWIGGDTKQNFSLLYKATRDECSPKMFHNKCDQRGPTVTLLYSVSNTVFGGYTSVSWHSKKKFSNDHKAFLFTLKISGTDQCFQYPIKKASNAIYGHSGFGPTFGYGYDLNTMESKVLKNENEFFQLNGYCKIGVSYDVQGQNHEAFSNDNLCVLDIEVYGVEDIPRLDEPWREIGWSEQVRPGDRIQTNYTNFSAPDDMDRIKDSVVRYKPCEQLQVPQAKILLLGSIGAGKSSFINTLSSTFTGHITSQANCGRASSSLTTVFRSYVIRNGPTKKPLNFRLFDTPGLEDGNTSIDADNIGYILDGHVPDHYQFTQREELSPKIPGWKKSPSLADRVHCVAFVLPCTSFDIEAKHYFQRMKNLQSKMNERGIPQVVLMTKIDNKCELVDDDVSEVIYSPPIFENMKKASTTMGLPRAQILPMKNYESEMELDRNISILSLFNLRQILNYADGYFLNCLDAKSDD